jgi:hypothetical protein
MQKLKLLGTVSIAASLLALPAFAQNNNNNGSANGPAHMQAEATPHGAMYSNLGSGGYTAEQVFIHNGNNGNGGGGWNGNNANNGNNNWRPSQRNPDLADNGDARASKVIGTSVYNERDQKLGSIDDVLIGKNGVHAIISTNNKKVAVPFNQLRFGNASVAGDNKIVLPNETQAQLNTEPVVHYNETNYQSARNNNNGGGPFARNGNGNGWNGNGNGNGNGGPFSGSSGPGVTGNGPFNAGNGGGNGNTHG